MKTSENARRRMCNLLAPMDPDIAGMRTTCKKLYFDLDGYVSTLCTFTTPLRATYHTIIQYAHHPHSRRLPSHHLRPARA